MVTDTASSSAEIVKVGSEAHDNPNKQRARTQQSKDVNLVAHMISMVGQLAEAVNTRYVNRYN